jgi:hypothetical protein
LERGQFIVGQFVSRSTEKTEFRFVVALQSRRHVARGRLDILSFSFDLSKEVSAKPEIVLFFKSAMF